ncbi:MAG: Ig-like domain-containing protein [Candidatus Thorarchaeota archaeon]
MRNRLILTICFSVLILCTLMSTSPTSMDLQFIEARTENILIVEEQQLADDPQTLTFDRWTDAFSYDSWYAERDIGTGLYGSFETESGGVDFFICDDDNYNLWAGGFSAYVYNLVTDSAGLDWSFEVPYTDTWHFVYSNLDSFNQVRITGWHRIDRTAPVIVLNLGNGDICSGEVQVTATVTDETFEVASVTLLIDGDLVDTETDEFFSFTWDTTEYSEDSHTLRLTATDSLGNSDYARISVTVANSNQLIMTVAAAGLVFVALAGIAAFMRFRSSSSTTEPTIVTEVMPESVSARICAQCGTPLEGQARFCMNCGKPI